jgi:transmembrane sensor
MKENFTNYTVEELAAEESFIDWVIEKKEDSAWSTWMSNHPDFTHVAEEAASLVQNLHNSRANILTHTQKQKMWSHIKAHTSTHASPGNTRRLWIAAAASIAACFVFFMVFLPKQQDQTTLVTNTQSDAEELVLPDASIIALDQQASVQYDKENFKTKRELSLQGQAFFQVEKGEHFLVKTTRGTIEVLGTSFNVNTKNSLAVECYTGSVRVTIGQEQVILTAGKKTDYDDNTKTLRAVDMQIAYDQPEWMSPTVKLDNVSLQEAIYTIEDLYKVQVKIADNIDKSQKYSGILIKNDIEKALKALVWPLRLSYELEGNYVSIKKEK